MDIINIIAIITSPLVAVIVSIWLQNRKEMQQRQLHVLNVLIASRHELLAPENIRALNTIDMVFHDKPSVRRLWRECFEMLNNAGLNNPQGWQQQNKKFIELITEMAKVLGYGKAISHLDVDRIYNPVGIVEQITRNQELQKELLRVLKETKSLAVIPHEPRDGGDRK